MRLEATLQQKLTQELRLAPQIIQSIEILQLPVLELNEFIQQELETNPFLEQVEQKEEFEETDSPKKEETSESVEDTPLTTDDSQKEFEKLEEIQSDWNEYFSQINVGKRVDDGTDKKLEAMQNTAAKPISLQDHLFQQFSLLEISEKIKIIGEQVIYNLNSNGYLQYPLEEIILSVKEFVPTIEEAQKALSLIQSLDPPGVGARDTQECLILQLDPKDPDYKFKKELITEHLHDIYENKYPKISKMTGRSLDEVKLAVESIRRLNPKPGREFSSESSQPIIPDVVVECIEGEYEIRLEDDYVPHLRISSLYNRLMKEDPKNPKVREFVKKKFESARWLIESIEQRQNTLYRVTDDIVKHQRDFLDHGITHIKPLKMQEVGDRLNIHVSTVSRAISDKYIQTPRGIFPMKFFFTGAISSELGEEESRVSVKQRVQDIIQKEDKKNPLSDEEIADILQKVGLNIARRTVTKYRKALGIPSSRRRKEY